MGKRIAQVVAVVVLVALGIGGWHVRKLIVIGSGYAAVQTCSCLFVSGRPLESCRADLDPMAQRMITITPGDKQVRAGALGISATGRYEADFGCSIID